MSQELLRRCTSRVLSCAEVPTAKLVMIENCKTLVCWDQPERLAQLIAEFTAAS